MKHDENRIYLINRLLQESEEYKNFSIPNDFNEQWILLRSLMNIRYPKPIDDEFIKIQDEFLRKEIEKKGIVDISELTQVQQDLYVWKGDITTLKCDGIVNAANSQMLGCFYPNHGCIDNAIHTYAGIQLRLECADIMRIQGSEEQTGKAKITQAYNLPCKYILHTVGPIVYGKLTEKNKKELSDCYSAGLTLAEKQGLRSIAFCCISTGEFHFPNQQAAEIAVETVKCYKSQNNSDIKVIFNVFKAEDYDIYRRILG